MQDRMYDAGPSFAWHLPACGPRIPLLLPFPPHLYLPLPYLPIPPITLPLPSPPVPSLRSRPLKSS